jgi:signal recognition particle GTPase
MKAFDKLGKQLELTDEAVKEFIKEATRAVMEADVPINLVQDLRTYIETTIDPQKIAAGANKRELVKEALIQGLFFIF